MFGIPYNDNDKQIICRYDVTNEASLAHVESRWWPEIEEFGSEEAIVMLIGIYISDSSMIC